MLEKNFSSHYTHYSLSKYLARPRRSLRTAANMSSNSSQNKSIGSNRSERYDSSGNESDSFEYSSQDGSLNSTTHSDRFQRYSETNDEDGFIMRERYTNIRERYVEKREISKQIDSKPKRIAPKSDSSDTTTMWIGLVLIVIVAIGGGIFYLSMKPKMAKQNILCPQFKELQKQFTRQDQSLWKSLKVGIENMLNKLPPQPNVFLLAYNDHETSEAVMASILNVTATCMQSNDPIKLNGRTFVTESMLQDYGEIIETYRDRLEHEGIMYVADLHEIPGQAAQAFHTICDTVTPFVERSIIFFTLYVDQYDEQMKPKKVHELVEAKLERNWADINHNTLKALIGRVTDQVFLLRSEN